MSQTDEQRLSELLHELVPNPPLGSINSFVVRRRAVRRAVIGATGIAASIIVALAVALPLILVGDRTQTVQSGGDPRRNVWAGYLSFSAPKDWQVNDFDIVSHGFSRFGPFVANVPLRNPCAQTTVALGSQTTCSLPPVQSLRPETAYAEWLSDTQQANPHPTHAQSDRQPSFAEPVYQVLPAPHDCRRVGGTHLLTAQIRSVSGEQAFEFRACMNGTATSEIASTLRGIASSAEPSR
jgi:hypothetical protein